MPRISSVWCLSAIVLSWTMACRESATPPLPAVPTPQEAAAAAARNEAESEWRTTVDVFFEAIRPTVGEAPVECNTDLRHERLPPVGDAPPELLRAWLDCTRSASAAGRGSIIVLSQPTIDSWGVSGMLVSSDGRATAFVYDAVFGNGRYFMLGPCASPTPRAAGTGLYGMRCGNERRDGKVPMSEQPLPRRRSPAAS